MRFDIRTLARTISALVIAFFIFAGTLAPAMAQGKGKWRSSDRRHYGWERGRHRGWEHSRHRGRMWRNDDNRRFRRRAFRRHQREERRAFRRFQRRNRAAFYGPPVREGRFYRRASDWRNRRY